MRRVACVVCVVGLGVSSGCLVPLSKYDALLDQNQVQSARIKSLQRELDQLMIEAEAARNQLKDAEAARRAGGALADAKDAQLAALQARCYDLEARIRDIVDKLGKEPKGGPLPGPVVDALEQLAKSAQGFEFDPKTGTCKFSADILFESGDDTVRSDAKSTLKKFANIFTGVGKGLALRIEGHTDDRPIARETTRAKHPTNWHLSIHRAISVLNELAVDGLAQNRMCAAGYGKWRPAVPNTNDAARAKNRRVEIIVTNPPVAARAATPPETTVLGGE